MSDSTVYLTFDDGPLGGTDDVIATLNEMKVGGTLFMVGSHVNGKWSKNQVTAAHVSPYVEVGNHSNTHANNDYTAYYANTDGNLEKFKVPI